MEQGAEGDWVRAEDVDALQARIRAAVAAAGGDIYRDGLWTSPRRPGRAADGRWRMNWPEAFVIVGVAWASAWMTARAMR